MINHRLTEYKPSSEMLNIYNIQSSCHRLDEPLKELSTLQTMMKFTDNLNIFISIDTCIRLDLKSYAILSLNRQDSAVLYALY